MKLPLIFGAFFLLLAMAKATQKRKLEDLPVRIDLDEVAKMTAQELDSLAAGLAAEEIIRTKRSEVGYGVRKISSGIGSKIALLGQASAGASSFLSGKGHGEEHHGYSYDHPEPQAPKLDFWTLKKSILNTLFQAVKAITGGVTILKGQLIKGGGALAQGLGKVIKLKGDAVTNLGKHIVNSASLVPPKKHAASIHVAPLPITAPHPVHLSAPSGPSVPISSYGPPASAPAPSYGPPSGPAPSYGPPSGSGHYYNLHTPSNSIYNFPNKYNLPLEGNGYNSAPSGVQAGVVLFQPLPSNNQWSSNYKDNSVEPVSSAYNALKGILSTAPSGHSPVTVPGTGPSGEQALPNPAPYKQYSSPSAYESYPSFKPLNIDKQPLINSYGSPLTHDSPLLQSMADSILSSGPSYESYLQSFPEDNHGSHSSRSTIIIKDGKGLQPLDLSKINDNIDKLNEARKKHEKISLFSKRLGLIDRKSKELESSDIHIDKSITYELRGNRIVRLVDGIEDV